MPILPEKREKKKKGKGKEKHLGTFILHTFTHQKVEDYEISTTQYQTTRDNVSLIRNKAFVH